MAEKKRIGAYDPARFSYVLLTNTVPESEYQLGDGSVLIAIQPVGKMYNGNIPVLFEEPHAFMALRHFGEAGFDLYRDLVIFHSFIADNPDTYVYAATTPHAQIDNLHLSQPEERSGLHPPYRHTINFDMFSVLVVTGDDIKEEKICYRDAFHFFTNLKLDKDTKKLYDLICLWVFARGYPSIDMVYSNENLPTAFYVVILESLIGQPPRCDDVLHCDKCGRDLHHDAVSRAQHFISHYGHRLRKAVKIRHQTLHEGRYSQFFYEWFRLRLEEDDKSKLWAMTETLGRLEMTTGEALVKRFMEEWRSCSPDR